MQVLPQTGSSKLVKVDNKGDFVILTLQRVFGQCFLPSYVPFSPNDNNKPAAFPASPRILASHQLLLLGPEELIVQTGLD